MAHVFANKFSFNAIATTTLSSITPQLPPSFSSKTATRSTITLDTHTPSRSHTSTFVISTPPPLVLESNSPLRIMNSSTILTVPTASQTKNAEMHELSIVDRIERWCNAQKAGVILTNGDNYKITITSRKGAMSAAVACRYGSSITLKRLTDTFGGGFQLSKFYQHITKTKCPVLKEKKQ
ncbi:unnamed protein product [Didymodactylos carnosus]|uniref:Uncharacterized protein n=1 Tax=Didymodactylos carnosus TaxID=1234261 RepID=A0A815YP04_9BILA|nr:unnamed protein product [Didymodactylos carnosus]CAF1574301.1 unnamed protein product [Didymodactylos carnosus]CAF4269113.1 unnamed protein product [Didymodactylos carnosus]CAF4438743.1 unnamed protein product [Didymodactylos carnosus]